MTLMCNMFAIAKFLVQILYKKASNLKLKTLFTLHNYRPKLSLQNFQTSVERGRSLPRL